jgi:transposase
VPSNARRRHTREFKLECCRQAATGEKRPAQLCREHNLSESVLLRWRKEYQARGEAAFTEKQPSGNEALEAAEKPSWSVSAGSSPWRTRS